MIPHTIALLSLTSLLLTAHAMTDRLNPSTYSFTVGNFNGMVVSDGPVIFQQDVVQVPEMSRLRSLNANFRTSGPTVLGLNYVLIDTPTNRILVDTGAFNLPEFEDDGMFAQAGRIFENLQAAGVSRESINAVFLTHAHADHVGGLTQRDGSASFPNATVYIHRVDHAFWTADVTPQNNLDPAFLEPSIASYRRSIRPYEMGGRLVLVEDFETPLEGVTILPCRGHSVGHSCVQFTSQGESMIYTGDLFRTKWDQVQNPEWTLAIETNGTEGIESRLAFFEALHDRVLLVPSHEQFPSMGYIRKMGQFYDWVDVDSSELGTVRRVVV